MDDLSRRAFAALEEICGLAPEAQVTRLSALRAEAPALAAEVEALLAYDDTAGEMLRTGEGARALAVAMDSPSMTGRSIGDLVICERLGEGGAGEVYRAERRSIGKELAIKFLGPQQLHDARQLLRFRREFRAVARLEHPGCLRVFEQGVDGERHYYTMEYAPGGDLRALRDAPIQTLIAALLQLAEALDYIHSRGVIHRDLKPENVLLCPREPLCLKLADFGIAKVPAELAASLTGTGAILGTLDYLSPEQVQGRPVDPRSDLYALGCVAHTLLSGAPPFRGNPYQRLTARVERRPPPLREQRPEAPAALDDLVSSLLAPRPEDRPQSALAVAEELATTLAKGGAVVARPTAANAKGYLYRPAIVGRGAQLEDLVERCLQGGCRVALQAPAGTGKTALSEALCRALESRGGRSLTVNTRGEAAPPLAPFPALEATLRDRLGESAQATAPDASLDQRGPTDAAVARRQRAAALAQLLERAASDAPLLVVLEDMHDADSGALKLLDDLLAALSGTQRLSVVVTLRPGSALGSGGPLSVEQVAPLGSAAIATLAAHMLGISEAALPAGLLDRVTIEAEGNPLLAQSSLRGMVERAALRRVPGGWTFDLEAPAPQGRAEALSARLSDLSAETSQVLAAAAVAGRSFDVALLRETTGYAEETIVDAIDEALRADLLQAATGPPELDTYAFRHQRPAELLYDSVDAEGRRRLHEATGRVLQTREGAPLATLAMHFARGEDAVTAHGYLFEAGSEALAALDLEAARRHYAAALARVDALPAEAREHARHRCGEALSDVLVSLSRGSEAAELLRASLPATTKAEDRGRRLRKLGWALLLSNDTAGGLEALHDALGALGRRPPRSRLVLWSRIGWEVVAAGLRRILGRRPTFDAAALQRALAHRDLATLLRWVNLERGTFHAASFVRLAERLGTQRYLVEAYAMMGMALGFLGMPRQADRFDTRARAVAMSIGDRQGLARIEICRGGVEILVRDDPRRAQEHFDAGVRVAEAVGDPFLSAFTLVGRGWSRIFLGKWPAAEADFAQAQALGESHDVQWQRADADVGHAIVQVMAGRYAQGVEAARAVLARGRRLALPALEGLATETLGGEAFVHGRYREALAHFEQARDIYVRNRLGRGWGFLINLEHTEAALWLHDYEGEAAVPKLRALLRENIRSTIKHSGRLPVFRGYEAVLRGVYESRCGRAARARRLFDQGLQARRDMRRNYFDGWILTRVAFERQRLGGGRQELVAQLDEADALYAESGLEAMRQWLSRVRREHGLL